MIFSKIDLRSTYHHIRIKKEDICKTTFNTHYRNYEFIIFPFRLNNALATFMCLMNEISDPYLEKIVPIFVYEILIYSKNVEEHHKHLQVMFQTLLDYQLYTKYSKCEFSKDHIQYLGHIITQEVIVVDT